MANDSGTGVAALQVVFLTAGGAETGSFYVCGAAAAPTCIYDSFPFTSSYDFLTSMPPNTQRVRVKAWDFAGLTGQAERAINFVAIGYFDLWAQAMEITQGVQPWLPATSSFGASSPPTFTYPAAPTSVPLAADRTTVVRVYAGVGGTTGGQPLSNVRARLRCFTNAGYQTFCAGASEISPQNQPPGALSLITVNPAASLAAKRADTRLTWNFVLPDPWTAAGTVYLEAVVLAPTGLQECAGCENVENRLRISGVKFETVPSFTSQVHFVRIRRQLGTQTFEPTQAQMNAHVDNLRPRYPVSESTLPTTPDATWVYQDCGNNCDPDPAKNLGVRCNGIFNKLQLAFPNRANKLAVYALVDAAFPCAGVGGGGYSYGNASRTDTFPHEVGHAVGLNHSGNPPGHGSICPPPGGGNCAECNPVSWCDTDWPWPHGTLGSYGFDVFNMSVIVPGTTENDPHDFMSYGGPTQWVSSRSWIRVFNAFAGQKLDYPKSGSSSFATGLPAGKWTPVPPTGRYLIVRGEQTGGGDWVLLPSYELDLSDGSDMPGEGEYSIALLGADGAELYVRHFSIDLGHVDTLDRSGLPAPLSFAEWLPLADETRGVELRQGENLLAAMERSPHAPTVEILSPTSDGLEGQPDTSLIRWRGADVDGDSLRYMVRYQPQEGAEWQTLATDWTAEELATTLADYPGGFSARVQVLASDGFNTGEATSAPFVVQDKPPRVEILIPEDGTVVEEFDRLILRGAGSDLEGELDEGAYTWSSDRDGLLGAGSRIEVSTLSSGTHRITLTAEDFEGHAGTASITIEVTAHTNAQPVAVAGPDMTSTGNCSAYLDAFRSYDSDGDSLTYLWSIASAPPESHSRLSSEEGRTAHLFADRPGDYSIELVVHDGQVASRPDRLLVHVTGAPASQTCLYLPAVWRSH